MPTDPQAPSRNPGCLGRGCSFFLIAGLLLGGACLWGAYQMRTQIRALADDTLPVATPPSAARSPQTQADVRARVNAYLQATAAHRPARLELSAIDLNAMAQGDPALERFNAQTEFSITQDGMLELAVSVPFPATGSLAGKYFNGKLAFTLVAQKGRIACTLRRMTDGQGQLISPGLVNALKNLDWTSSLEHHPTIAPLSQHLRDVKVEGGRVILENEY